MNLYNIYGHKIDAEDAEVDDEKRDESGTDPDQNSESCLSNIFGYIELIKTNLLQAKITWHGT